MKLVIFSGAGISADSGISTFRDSDGLWAQYRIEDVCTPEALARDRDTVIRFYNQRRKELLSKEPNPAHYAIKELEQYYDVEVVTQNVDNLHERAGSQKILHLHGELMKLCSTADNSLIYLMDGWEQKLDARCPKGSLLRPYIVFFGEAVPLMGQAVNIVSAADILIVVGTSLAVYPAASLIHYAKNSAIVYVVDPQIPPISGIRNRVETIRMNAAQGMPLLAKQLIREVC
ncbi:MAG: NAD-dependent deacylase [Prevotellaceae bacterium]|nr:NAD-dependent deacylase [Prevotellaceae bacterium]